MIPFLSFWPIDLSQGWGSLYYIHNSSSRSQKLLGESPSLPCIIVWLFNALTWLIIVCSVNSGLFEFGFSSPCRSPHHNLPADNALFDRSGLNLPRNRNWPMDNFIASACLMMDGIDRYTASLGRVRCVVLAAVLSRALFDRSRLDLEDL